MESFYVVDIGGDAFDQPTKRDAIATARQMMTEPSVSTGGRWRPATAVYVYYSTDNPKKDRLPVFLTWLEVLDDGTERIGEAKDPLSILAIADQRGFRSLGMAIPKRWPLE